MTEPSRNAPRQRLPRWAVVLLALVLFGGFGVGTYASFSGSTTNDATFTTGSIVLTNKVNSGTVCVSAIGNTDVNANASCDKVFELATTKPGDIATADLDLADDGDLDASALTVYSGACGQSDAIGETFHGTGNPCGKVDLIIQEFASATARTNGTATGATCWYGEAGAEGAVAGANHLCASSFDTTRTLSHFAANHGGFATAIDLGPMTSGPSGTRFFRIGARLDPAAGNDVQGRVASIGLTWQIEQ